VICSGEIDRKAVDVDKETDVTVPLVGVVYSKFLPDESTERIWFEDPRIVKPVPPEVIGIGFDESFKLNVPSEVIVDGDTERNSGTDIEIELINVFGVWNSRLDPFEFTVNISPGWPNSDKPVPPWVGGIVEQSIDKNPFSDKVERKEVEVLRFTDWDDGSKVLYSRFVPSSFTVKIWFGEPRVVKPVPPEVIGIGSVWDILNNPEEVIVEGVTERNDGTDIDTDVTVPVPDPDTHPSCSGLSEMTERIWPFDPIAVIPVPPEDIGKGVWL